MMPLDRPETGATTQEQVAKILAWSAMDWDEFDQLNWQEYLEDAGELVRLFPIPAPAPTFEQVREALHHNLVDTTGECVCDPPYTERGLEDPHCAYHRALPTTDNVSVVRVLALLSAPAAPAAPAHKHRFVQDTLLCSAEETYICTVCGAEFTENKEDQR